MLFNRTTYCESELDKLTLIYVFLFCLLLWSFRQYNVKALHFDETISYIAKGVMSQVTTTSPPPLSLSQLKVKSTLWSNSILGLYYSGQNTENEEGIRFTTLLFTTFNISQIMKESLCNLVVNFRQFYQKSWVLFKLRLQLVKLRHHSFLLHMVAYTFVFTDEHIWTTR